jgi:hypothetical protein
MAKGTISRKKRGSDEPRPDDDEQDHWMDNVVERALAAEEDRAGPKRAPGAPPILELVSSTEKKSG